MNSAILPIGAAQSHDFLGKNGFLWWVGVVEDRDDPLGLGRARVRVFGHHHENQDVLPTDDLPWALALAPLSNFSAPLSPPVSTWVLGFFLDGQIGQQPVMIGALPGYRWKVARSENSNTTSLPT